MKQMTMNSNNEVMKIFPNFKQFAAMIDSKTTKPITNPSIIAEGGTEQISLTKLRPESIEKYLLMHPVIPRGIEIRANRMTCRGYNVKPANQSQQAKRAAREMEMLIKNSGDSVLLNNFIQNAYAFGDGYLTLTPNKKDDKVVLLNLEHPVFFRVARHKKKNTPDKTSDLRMGGPEMCGNFEHDYGAMKIDPITKKPEAYTQLKYDKTRSYYSPVGDELSSDQVAHLFFDSWGDEVTGISVLQYIHLTVNYLLNMEEAGAENIYRNGFTQKKITTELMTERELKEISRNIKDINAKDAVILPRGVDLDNLIPGNSQFPQFHDKFLNILAIRLGIPKPILTLDGSSTNKATMDTLTKDMMEDIKADETKVQNCVENQIFVPACRKLFGDNFAAFPTFEFNPYQESEDSKAARQFRIAQTLDALSRAVGTLIDKGYIKRGEQLLNYIDKILPEEKIEVENGTNKLNRRTKPTQKAPGTMPSPDQSKGEDAGTEGAQVGRPDGTDNVNIRGKRTSPKKPPEVKQR